MLALAAALVLAAADPGFGAGSHVLWSEQLSHSAERDGVAALHQFDDHLRAHPDDFVAAVEECSLADAIADPADDERAPNQALAAAARACRKRLDAPELAQRPLVRLYQLDDTFGAAAVKLGEQDLLESSTWTTTERAHLHASLARAYRTEGDTQKARDHALLAVELDPASDARLDAAEALADIGAPDRARALIEAAPAGTWVGWRARRAGAVLLRVGDAEGAVALLRPAPHDGDVAGAAAATAGADANANANADDADDAPGEGAAPAGPSLPFIDALIAAHRFDDARAQLALHPGTTPYMRRLLAQRSFALEQDHGTDAQLGAALTRLDDAGSDDDPLAHRRLALVFTHHALPWTKSDAKGVALLLAALLGLALAPVLIIAPVHYRGLARRRTRPFDDAPGFHLRHAWLVLALINIAGFIGAYAFDYRGLVAGLLEMTAVSEPRDLARSLILQTLINVLFLAPLAILHPELKILRGERWGLVRGLAIGAAAGVLLRVVLSVGSRFIPAVAVADPLAGDITKALTGVYVSYGGLPLVLLAAVAVPFVEELVFRGVLLTAFSRHVSVVAATAIQALLFAAAHFDLAMLPFFFLFGCCAALLRFRSGGALAAPMMMHAIFNATAAASIAIVSHRTNG